MEDVQQSFLSTYYLFEKIGGTHYGGMPFCIMSDGSMGFAPPLARKGDVIVHVRGGWIPVALRRIKAQERQAELIGTCYVHSIEDVYSGSDWEDWLLE